MDLTQPLVTLNWHCSVDWPWQTLKYSLPAFLGLRHFLGSVAILVVSKSLVTLFGPSRSEVSVEGGGYLPQVYSHRCKTEASLFVNKLGLGVLDGLAC